MSTYKPCAHCEQELPLSEFSHRHAPYCKTCETKLSDILKRKYGIIAAAHFRAKLRQRTKRLHEKRRAHT